jgi:hypothetical protein
MRAVVMLLLLAAPARADWLGDIWRGSAGLPAISLNGDGVSVTMPQSAMLGARAAGLSVEQAVGAFLSRYASRMCSELMDLNASQRLTVHLHVQGEVPAPIPGRLFVVDPDGVEMVIDYAPAYQATCIDPSGPS